MADSSIDVRQRPPRADRRARGRRLRACHRTGLGGAQPPQPRPHQRRHRRRQRRPRLHPDGGDRRRRALALLRPAPAPRGQPARRRRAVRDLPAVREAGLARRQSRSCSPRSSRRRSCSPRAASPDRCSSTCRWTSSRSPSTRRCSPASTTAPRRCTSRRSTTRPPRAIVTRLAEAERPVIYVGGGVLLSTGQRRAPTLRRPHGHPGRPQPDGQGRAQRRSSRWCWG